jgi:outer membrane lipoprotein-sorting protein
MNKTGLTLTYLIFSWFTLFSQQDPKAKVVLDRLSEKSKKYTSYKSEFTITTENKQDKSTNTQKGSIVVNGRKYHLLLSNSEIFFDGKTQWNYLPESNEVNITNPDPKPKTEDIFFNDPTRIFNIYQTDFKYKYIGESICNGRSCDEIDLYPFKLAKNYFRIKLFIDKSKIELVQFKTYGKSGINIQIDFLNFNSDVPVLEKEFIFDPNTHPGVEVNDMRM